jgi:hypothetical protein
VGWRDWQNAVFEVPRERPRDGWRLAGDDVYTCVAPPGYEKDPAVTAAIHSFDPDVIPLWRVQLWYPPLQDVPVREVRHGIGRHYPHPRYLRKPFHVELPQGWEGPEPNFLDVIFEDPKATNWIGPPGYIPWDWKTYRWCRAQFIFLTVDKYRRRVERHRARIEEARRKKAEEIEYIRRDLERRMEPRLREITPQDWQEYEQMRRTGRPRRPTIIVP